MPLLLAVIGVTVLALAGLTRRRFAIVTVVGESMLPTLASGDKVLMRRARISQLAVGAIVVIEKPVADGRWSAQPRRRPAGRRELMIKRVAAVPGDRWPAALSPAATPGPPDRKPVVPAGEFIVLGDNPQRSFDSRQLGGCPADRLVGVVLRSLASR